MNRYVWEIARGLGFHPLKQLHAFLYGMFTPRYLQALDRLAPHLPKWVKEHLAEGYHGKVLTLEEAIGLLSDHKGVEAPNLEKVIPYKHAKDLILRNPDHIVVYECPCRQLRENPCRPLDVCLIVGEPFAGAARFAHPEKTRWISSEEALSILKAEAERGHLHTAYFKDIMLDRFYAICNCCRCCCVQMRVFKEQGLPSLAPSGYVSEVSQECNGCGECAPLCPFDAIEVKERAYILYDKCFGCGICQAKCPLGAISLRRDAGKGEPLDIRNLSPKGSAGVFDRGDA